MLARAHTSTTAPLEQQKPQLLSTYPEHLKATLTPREYRASLAGQQYYLNHQHGTHATHAELCTFLKRKSKQWRRARTSIEWQTYFMSGWYAALLSDPTAEKEHLKVTSIKAGGEDDDENNRFPLWKPDSAVFGFDFAPIKAGEPTAQIARHTFGRDDDEERRPSFDPEDYEDFGWSLKHFPLWGQNGRTFIPGSALKTLKNSATWPIFPLWGQNGGTFNSLAETLLFGAQGFGRPGWSLMKLAPEGGDGNGWSIRPRLFASEDGDDRGWSLLFGPKDGGQPGWSLLFGPTGGDDDTWKRPVFGPEDGDETGWRLVFGPHGGGEPGWWIAGPHDGDDDTWGRVPLPPFGGDCERRRSLAPEDPTVDAPIRCASDDETEERCPSFGDEEGGWYRSRLPHYAKQRLGGASLLTRSCGSPLPLSLGEDSRRPLFESDLPDDDGWHHPRPCFPLAAGGPIWPDTCLEALGGATWL